ncbi:MAG: IS1595 family transposase [Dehalococcoidia bacterium]|nr:IS1595 family transposase [Dehalococcoidia bacterium]
MPVKSVNLMSLMERFHSEEACREVLAELRWPDGVKCPRCQGDKHAYDSGRFVWDCYSCGYQFSAMAGTIFHDTKLPLSKWFVAVLLMVEAKKGISANQMKRTIGVSYKTAWYLCHRIRAAMKDAAAPLLSGIVEVDETYVGGKVRGKGRGYRDNKTIVLGAIERGGGVRLKVEKRNDRKTLHAFIKAVVDDGAVAIHTDEWEAYKGIADANTRHETVNHKAEEWVRADVHTNTVEGVWSLFKRSIVGSYHQLSEKHMDAYLDEMAFRFNNRSNPYLFRDTLIHLVRAQVLPYSELTAAG